MESVIQPTGDPSLDDALAPWFARAAERRRELEAWLATVPQSQPCAVHPDFIRRLVPDKSGFDDAFYEPCPKCVSAANERAEIERLRKMGVPLNLCGAKLDNWQTHGEDDKAILETCRRFAEVRRGFLLFLGDLGTGKTHLAVAVLRTFRCGWFVKQSELLRRLRDTYRDKAAVNPVDQAQDVALLVLDEMGLSSGGRDELPMLHDILDHRHGNQLPTILTGNLTKDQLAAVVGERMTDRLRESTFAVLTLSGPSYRGAARESYFPR